MKCVRYFSFVLFALLGVFFGSFIISPNSVSAMSVEDYFSLSSSTDFSSATSSNGSVSFVGLGYSYNSNSSVGRFYGSIDVNSSSGADTTITMTQKSSFRPSSKIVISSVGINTPLSGYISYPVSVEIDTDGTVQFKTYMEGNKLNRLIIHPSLLFFNDFVPDPPESSDCSIEGDVNISADLSGVINAIYVLSATILVIYFFYCIYRMIIKNSGVK